MKEDFYLLAFSCDWHIIQSINYHIYVVPTFIEPEKKLFEKIVGKGENAVYKHFLCLPQYFLTYQTNFVF